MVDRVNKALFKMTLKERKQVLQILELIKLNEVANLDIKKLQGIEDTYRVRKGSFRIIFQRLDRETIRIVDVERRSDTTYNEY